MEPSPSDLARSLARLEQRVAALETVLAAAGGPSSGVAHLTGSVVDPSSTALPQAPDARRADLVTIPALAGRTFLALAGAYLLRALTDSAVLRPEVGVAAGLAYAALWFALANRATTSRTSAAFHGLVASLVAFPLVWEATMKFGIVTPAASAAGLALVIAVGLGVAARRRLQLVAWTVALLGASVATALVPATDRIVPFAVVLIALGVATLWIGYLRDWLVLRWPMALAADLAVVGVTVRVASGHGVEATAAALSLQILLIAGYLVSILVRTLVRGRDVIPFEVVQGIVALTVGLGGAVAVARTATAGTIIVGVATAALGAACYATAFVFIEKRQGERANFYFYTTLALMLVLASTHLLLASTFLTLTLSALTVGAAFVAASHGPRFIVIHAAIYGSAAALASGLLAASTARVLAPGEAWPAFAWPMVAALGAVVAAEAIRIPARGGVWDFWSHAPRLVLLLLVMWGGGGLVIDLVARAVAGGSVAIGPGALATVRTAVLSAAALGLARLGRHDPFLEAQWVVLPVLLTGGVKLLVEDLPRSQPATLFLAFAAYGVALIVAPRLLHRKDWRPTESARG